MQVIEVQHVREGQIIWENKKVRNLLHYTGQEFILRACFTGGRTSTIIPDYYYLGLDNRTALTVDDEMGSLIAEPSANGYTRQMVSSSGDFTVTASSEFPNFRVISPIVAFQAAGGPFGPVQNLFLTNKNDSSGYLISSVPLGASVTASDGDIIRFRLAMTLKDCS